MGGNFNGDRKLSLADGFTLLEILVTMAILTILGAFAVPQWGNLLSKYRLDSAARQVATELHGAKNRAMAQYRRVKLVFDSPTTYTIQKEQNPGEGDYTAISGSKSLPLGITVIEFNNTPTPVFQTRGNASPGATITLTNSKNETKEVVVALTGRIEIR